MNWVSQIDVKNLYAKLQLCRFFFCCNSPKRYVTTFLNAYTICDSLYLTLSLFQAMDLHL